MDVFDKSELKKLYWPGSATTGEDNGQVTVIGGSKLFHGAPVFALKVVSRIVDMTFFASPDKSVGRVAEKIKSKLMSFIWIPWDEVDLYVEKSDSVLIGPGFLRYHSEKVLPHDRYGTCDEACRETHEITKRLLAKFPHKRWVIDAGSLQVMQKEWIPQGAILTPNKKEFLSLFMPEFLNAPSASSGHSKFEVPGDLVSDMAKKYNCTIVLKGQKTLVCSPHRCIWVEGGNAGLTKGGTGDTQAGLTAALYAKNDAFLAASASAYVVKAAADKLHSKSGVYYNADDLADNIPQTLYELVRV